MPTTPAEIQTLLAHARRGDHDSLARLLTALRSGDISVGSYDTGATADNPAARIAAAMGGDQTEPSDYLSAVIEGALDPDALGATDAEFATLLNAIRLGDLNAIGDALSRIEGSAPTGSAPTAISLSADSIRENAAIGTTIATISANGDPAPTFLRVLDVDSKFDVVDNRLVVANLMDYETKTFHDVTIQAVNEHGSVNSVFRIGVINQLGGGTDFYVAGSLEYLNLASQTEATLPEGMAPQGNSFRLIPDGDQQFLTFGEEWTADATRYTYRWTVSGVTSYFDSRIREPGHYQISMKDPNGVKGDLEFWVLPNGMSWGDPWDFEALDHWHIRSHFQEDLEVGAVSLWEPRGMITTKSASRRQAVQSDIARLPQKLSGLNGVEFPRGAFLTWDQAANQRTYTTRCTLTIFRADPTSGTSTTFVTCPSQSGLSNGSIGRKNRQSALILYPSAARMDWADRAGANSMIRPGFFEDYADWHFVIHWHRDNRLFVSWDGAPPEESDNVRFRPGRQEGLDVGDNGLSYFGHSSNSLDTAIIFALDSYHEFPECSEELINKIGWWAKQRIRTLPGGEAFDLPVGHKYRTTDAVVDQSDFPRWHHKFVPGDWRWFSDMCLAMRADKVNHPNFANRGSYATLPPFLAEYSDRIFLDDFRFNSVKDSDSSSDGIWYSLGGAGGITVGASTLREASTGLYVHYPDDGPSIGLRATNSSGLRGSLMGMVDLLDNGITTKGSVLFQFKYRCVDQGTPRTGMWSALWSYANCRLKAPAAINTEIDFPEMERWSNTAYTTTNIARHEANAYANWRGRLPREARNSDNRLGEKLIDVAVRTDTYTVRPFPETINHWRTDGEWNTQTILLGYDYYILWINGFEIGRFEMDRYDYLQRFHWMLQNVHRTEGTTHANSSEWGEMRFKEFEIFKRPEDTAKIEAPFTSRPVISGTLYPGSIAEVTVGLPGVNHIKWEWYYDDGYPIGSVRGVRGNKFPIKAEDTGKRLRVKALSVGHWEDAEVWSNPSAVIGGGLNTLVSADLNFSTGSYTVNGTTYSGLAALQAAWPIGFQRPGPASMHYADDTFAKRIAPHVPRLHALGLVYMANAGYANRIVGEYGGQVGGSGYISQTFAEDSPLGPKSAVAWRENASTSIHPRVTLSSGGLTNGNRYSGTVLVKPGYRKWLQLYSNDDPNSFDSLHRAWYHLEGAGALGTVQGDVTASIYALQGTWEGWYMCSWSKVAVATDTVSEPPFYIGFRGANGAQEEIGDPLQVAGYFAGASTSLNAGWYTDFYFLHLLQVGATTDELTLPLGSTPKTVEITTVNPWTGAEVVATLTGQTGDWILPTQQLPIIKRVVVSVT